MWTHLAFVVLSIGICYGRLPEMIPRTNLRCGEFSIYKQTHMSSEGEQVGSECIYRFRARNKLVCQIRVDFDTALAPPTVPSPTNGLQAATCVDDILEINGLRICGFNRDQHVYIPFDRSLGVESMIRLRTSARVAGSALPAPTWNIQVTQLECPLGSILRGARSDVEELPEGKSNEPELRTFLANDGMWLAPVGCTQYFTEPTGTVQSFNFNGATGIYPGNMRYAICFRRTTGTRSLQLRFTTFQIGSELTNMDLIDTGCYSTVQTTGRSEDFLQIPFALIPETSERANLFCGNKLAAHTVTSSAPGPLVIYFNSDGVFKVGSEVGFQLTYSVL